ncbi:hypothetical protein [Spiroplasma endosymbiont of Virgichneumon dumeticola]|uniref:hypothetical protein n=1 Tax=Spiroplasma endosymbiont of Virgichneumon dumeticola TaxID=3139323 RepID=UPI0035C8ACF4
MLKNEKDNLVKVNKELTNQIQNSNTQKEKRKLQEKLKKNETLLKEVTSKLTQLEIENQQLTIQNQQRLSTEIELQNKIETLNQELQNLQPAVDLSSSYDLCPATCVTKHIQNVTSTYTQYLYESSNNNTIVTPVEVTTDIPVVVAVNIESGVYLKPGA